MTWIRSTVVALLFPLALIAGPHDYDIAMPISWEGGGLFVRLDLSLDGGQTWPIPIAYGVPTGWPQTNYLAHIHVTPDMWTETGRIGMRSLWVENVDEIEQDGPEGDLSDADFTLAGLRILSPTNGQHVTIPGFIMIRWHEAGTDWVNIGVSTNSGDSYTSLQVVACPGVSTNQIIMTLFDVEPGSFKIAVQGSPESNLFDIVTLEAVTQ